MGTATSFSNTPQAKDDEFYGFSADFSGILTLDVMGNDLGGKAKTLWSIDDGVSASTNTKNYAPVDLLTKDGVGVWHDTVHGAKIAITADGKIAFDTSTAAFQAYLATAAEGVDISESFTYAIRMANGTLSWATVTVFFTGVNDAPVITGADTTGGATEIVDNAPNELTELHSATGTISFTDVDGTDSHTVAAAPDGSGYVGTFTAVLTDSAEGDGAGEVTWTFEVLDADIDHLAAGEVLTQTYTVTIEDEHGGVVTQQITITITGTNDAPEITGAVATGDVTEDADDPVLSTSGTIDFADVDLADGHTVGAVADGGNTLGGTLDVQVTDVSTGDGAGQVTWTYEVANAAVQYLSAGETVTESFTVTVDDGEGGTATQVITVTITGTNDAPEISVGAGDSTGDDLTEGNAGLAASGTLSVTDVDVSDAVTPSVVLFSTSGLTGGLTAAQLAAMLTVSPDPVIDGASTSGVLTWDFDSGAQAFDFLNTTDTLTLVYTITVSDGIAFDEQQVTITITGTNDAATIAGDTSGAVTEATASSAGTPVASGTLTAADVDNDDNVFQAASGATSYGSFSIDAGGNWTYTLDNSNAAVDALDTGDTLADSFTVYSQDGTSQVVNITIHGATDNQPPVAVNDVLWVSNSTTATFSLATILGNDYDVDGLAITITGFTAGTGLSGFTLNGNGTFSFTTDGAGGTTAAPTVRTFTYSIADGLGGTATGTVTVNVVSAGAGAQNISLAGVGNYQGAYIDAGAQADTLTSGATGVIFLGGTQNDVLNGGAGNDILRGGAGGDTMDGGAGIDLLDFSDASGGINFTLVQSSANTSVGNSVTGLGNDEYRNMEGVIGSNTGNDTLNGSASDDVLWGMGGNDILNGNAGNDTLRGGAGDDTMDGGTGIDLLDFSDATGALNFTLVQSSSNTVVNLTSVGLGTDTYLNMEGVIGSSYNDILVGSTGNDVIVGGLGADTMTGGGGNDTFVWRKGDANAVDTITDFGAGDVLDVSDLLAGSGINSGNVDDYLSVRESGGNTILSVDRDGGGALPSQDLVVLQGVTGNTLQDLLDNAQIKYLV
jgi:VCBS repeat-containing protein